MKNRPATNRRPGRRIVRRAVDLLGSLLTALLVFAATPTVLVTVVGDPLGGGLGHEWHQGGRVALAVVTLVAWLAWLGCCTQLTRSIVAQVRRGQVSAPSGAVFSERVAARIAAGVLSLIALVSPLALTAGGAGATGRGQMTPAGPVSAPLAGPFGHGAPPATSAPSSPAEESAAPASSADSYVVRPGDSLWSIAEAELGAGDDWPAIAALNLGHTMSDGLRFVDPSQIYAGWTLQLPDSSGTAPAPAVAPAPAPAPAVAVAVTAPSAPSAPTSPPAQSPRVTAPSAPAAGRRDELPAPAVSPSVRHRPPIAIRPAGPGRAAVTTSGAGPGHLGLPELSLLGIGALTCAAVARRSRRAGMLRRLAESPPLPERPKDAIDADVLVQRFRDVPALEAFEAANYALARALAHPTGSSPVAPARVRAICVGAAGIDFWLAERGVPAPPGLTVSSDGRVWHAGHDTLARPERIGPRFPIVLPLGEDEAGTWLVPVEPGQCVPLVGEAADDLWRAARSAQEAWSWADMVVVTQDPTIVARELRHHGAGVSGSQILFFGDPGLLPPAHAHAVATVTGVLVPGSEVTVLVDRHAASIHPLARTVRPHLMTADTADIVAELVAGPTADDSPLATDRLVATFDVDGDDGEPALSFLSPGVVEVKLLTPTPRLEGLRDPLPANRVRRATELVAYLALHDGDEVTSDRLRTRVLGSSDADAASKTLFNIATAARRAMGVDDEGAALFPAGSRTGHYRVSAAVSVDVHRAATLAAQAATADSPQIAMGLLRAALSLVEGEPMANALSGYAWWEAEGHGARIAAVLVNAASDLAALALREDLFELAQWGLDQARLADPYSEAISRTAMQVAAAAGDADRLRREWRECQRRIDELDPGSSPSPRTEQLYGELAQRVLVGDAGDSGDTGAQANFAAMEAAPRSTRPSAPAAL